MIYPDFDEIMEQTIERRNKLQNYLTKKQGSAYPLFLLAMLVILEAGGFGGGGINFDAKIRRNSTDPEDLFHAHIGCMDCCQGINSSQ